MSSFINYSIETPEQARRAIVKVGDGRGFVVQGPYDRRVVLTAAHCLPAMPLPHAGNRPVDVTFSNLIGRIGEAPSIAAECLFACPIADLAALGCPDDQTLNDEADAFEELTDAAAVLRVVNPLHHTSAWLLSLDQQWFRCHVTRPPYGALSIDEAAEPIVGGMSGSPIVLDDGTAIGVLCCMSDTAPHGPNPRLFGSLPGWLLQSSCSLFV